MSDPVAGAAGEPFDLVVIGGGVMGLFTAWHAVRAAETDGRRPRVAVLERGRVGDPATASFGRTRSYRRDYLDPHYARLADEAIGLWGQFERAAGVRALVRCGCMNIAATAVTPDLAQTYAAGVGAVLDDLGWSPARYRGEAVWRRFPYLRADLADNDETGGLVDVRAVTAALRSALEATASLREGVEVLAVEPAAGETESGASGRGMAGSGAAGSEPILVRTDRGDLSARSVVITAGHGSNDVLSLIPGNRLQVPISRDRPSEARYFAPSDPAPFTAPQMPVIAYLDTGIYLHPIVPGLIDRVKIGYYNPPDIPRGTTSIGGIADFVRQCLPGLSGAPSEPVDDVDSCDYDLVADDDFVLGAVPGAAGVYLGVGWRGTGYKFAPLIGRVLHDLARRRGTVYDIARFDPIRFLAPDGGSGRPQHQQGDAR